MIKIVPAPDRYVGKQYFSLLTDSGSDYCDRHLTRFEFSEEDSATYALPLGWFSHNPYTAVERLGIDLGELRETSAYWCDVLDMRFQAAIPTHLVTSDLKAGYPTEAVLHHYALDMLCDASWWNTRLMTDLSRHAATMMGPGYTDFFRPHDGSSRAEDAAVRLSNGDHLLVKVWHWFNK